MQHKRQKLKKMHQWRIEIIYEDKHILLVNKPAGIIVHPNDSEQDITLLNQVRNYLAKTGAWNVANKAALRPMPCNRLDRFSSGIVIFAKTWEAMRMLNKKIQQREVDKKYRCIVIKRPNPAKGKIENYLLKNRQETYVTIHKTQVPGSQYACTEYHTLASQNKLTLLECRLITGRTHQLRAQLASIGCPILGDMKYGDRQFNYQQGQKHQLLSACQITFSFSTDAGILNYLCGKTFRTQRSLEL